MAPASLDLIIRTGDTEQVTLYVTNNGTPVNVTGRTFIAQIRLNPSSLTPIASFTCVITDAAGGVVTCTLSATVTAALTPVSGVWDLQETNGSTVTTLVAGFVEIVQDISR